MPMEGKMAMRIVRYSLATFAVIALLGVSVALVLRDFPAGSEPVAAERAGKTVAAKSSVAGNAPVRDPAEPGATTSSAPNAEPASATPTPPSSLLAPETTVMLLAPPPQATRASPQPAVPTRSDPAAPPPLNLTAAQQAKVRDLLLTHTIMQAAAPDFPLQQGATVPENVPLLPVPHELADAIPNFQRYSYVIAQDRIVIVATERREIRFLISI
jgi:hypothetical protein